MGALVKTPALYLYLSGRNNLVTVGNALGGVPKKRIDEVLELVGVAAKDGAGCQAIVVGAVCLCVIDDRPPATLHLFVTNPSYLLHTSQSYFQCDLIQDP